MSASMESSKSSNEVVVAFGLTEDDDLVLDEDLLFLCENVTRLAEVLDVFVEDWEVLLDDFESVVKLPSCLTLMGLSPLLDWFLFVDVTLANEHSFNSLTKG